MMISLNVFGKVLGNYQANGRDYVELREKEVGEKEVTISMELTTDLTKLEDTMVLVTQHIIIMIKKELSKFKFIKDDIMQSDDFDFTSWLNAPISNIDITQFTIQPSIMPPNISYVNYNVETNKLEYYCPIENLYKEINT